MSGLRFMGHPVATGYF